MHRLISILAACALAAAAPAIAQTPLQLPDGLWLNPHGTVAVRTGACQNRLCGWIVWASPEAEQDARDSGIDRLIGIELLSDYRSESPASWSGSVFVPDMGHHFSSTITELSPTALKVQGCLIGGFLCKSQVWQRIEKLPNA
jgi:uncharacterized protein (DUF2147 family)